MIKFFNNMLILLGLLKNKNILYNLLNQVLTFFRCKKLDNRVIEYVEYHNNFRDIVLGDRKPVRDGIRSGIWASSGSCGSRCPISAMP